MGTLPTIFHNRHVITVTSDDLPQIEKTVILDKTENQDILVNEGVPYRRKNVIKDNKPRKTHNSLVMNLINIIPVNLATTFLVMVLSLTR